MASAPENEASLDGRKWEWLKKMGGLLDVQISPAGGESASNNRQLDDEVANRQQASVDVAIQEWESLVREKGSTNRGTRVDDYIRNAGLNPKADYNKKREGVQGAEWCGAFVGFAMTQSGFKDAPSMASYQKARDYFLYRSYTGRKSNEELDELRAQQEATGSTRQYFILEGSDSDTAEKVKKKGKYGQGKYGHYDPDANTFEYQSLPIQPGDVALFKHGHVGMVKSYDPQSGALETIEGNTGGTRADDTKAGANAVVQKKYDLTKDKDRTKFDGFGRPSSGDFQGEAPEPKDEADDVSADENPQATTTTLAPITQSNKRTVPGGGGYVYEQHADGKIFIVDSPKVGKKRTEVQKGTKGYEAILAEIGPFPASAEAAEGSSASEESLFDDLVDSASEAAKQVGDVVKDVYDETGKAIDKVADFLGIGGESADQGSAPPPANDDKKDVDRGSPNAATPEITGGAETETEKKLAEFTHAMSNIVVNVNGEPVSVRPPYHINRGHRKADAVKQRAGNSKVNAILKKVFKGQQGKGAKTGKATPQQMQRFLQESVDQKLVKDTSAKGLRNFLDEYGISTDCSGLAVQALNYLNDGNMTRDGDEQINASNTGTGTLARYPNVKSPAQLQAGDMMVKGGSHVRLLIDVDTEDDGIYFTTLESTAGKVSQSGDGVGERRWRFPDPGKFKNLEIQRGDVFKAAGGSDQSYIYTRSKLMAN